LLLGIILLVTVIIAIILAVHKSRRRKAKALEASQSLNEPLSSRKKEANTLVNRWRAAAGIRTISFEEQRDARYKIQIDERLKVFRSQIFPYHFVDVEIIEDMTQEPMYPAIMKEIMKLKTIVDIPHIRNLIKVKKFMSDPSISSMATPPEVDQMYLLLLNIMANKVPGDVVELGVWKGGMAMFMKLIMDFYRSNRLTGNRHGPAIQDDIDRCLWLFDAFDFFPAPRPDFDGLINAKDLEIHSLTKLLYNAPVTPEEVRDNFLNLGLMGSDRCDLKIVKGEFRETVPAANMGPLAILRIDCDYYDSVMYCLESLYDRVSPGGYVVLDDYNNTVIGCNQAVHDFRSKRGIDIPITDTYGGSVYWQIV